MSTLFFFLLWFTGLSFSLRLLHSALLFPGRTLRSMPCLSYTSFWALSIFPVLLPVCSCSFLPCRYFLPSWAGQGTWASLALPFLQEGPFHGPHGSTFFAKYFPKYWIIGEERRGDVLPYGWFLTISKKFIWHRLLQNLHMEVSRGPEQSAARCYCWVGGGCHKFLTDHLLHHSFF